MVDKVIQLEAYRVTKGLIDEVAASLEPVAGDPILGVLDSPLIGEFANVAKLEWQINDFNDIIKDRIASNTSQVAREVLDRSLTALDDLQVKVFETDAEAYQYFAAVTQYNYRRAKLVYDIRTHVNNFTHRYEVRAGFKVVQLGKKYS